MYNCLFGASGRILALSLEINQHKDLRNAEHVHKRLYLYMYRKSVAVVYYIRNSAPKHVRMEKRTSGGYYHLVYG